MNEIYATLKYGRYMSDKRVKIVNICLSIIISLFILLFSLFIIFIYTFISEKSWDIIIPYVLLLTFILISIVVTYKSTKTAKHQQQEIQTWYNNSVKIKAFSYRLDIVDKKYKPYQIAIKFKYGDKEIIKVSSPGSIIKGWHKEFANYDNKRINILYSPIYDEVIILNT